MEWLLFGIWGAWMLSDPLPQHQLCLGVAKPAEPKRETWPWPRTAEEQVRFLTCKSAPEWQAQQVFADMQEAGWRPHWDERGNLEFRHSGRAA